MHDISVAKESWDQRLSCVAHLHLRCTQRRSLHSIRLYYGIANLFMRAVIWLQRGACTGGGTSMQMGSTPHGHYSTPCWGVKNPKPVAVALLFPILIIFVRSYECTGCPGVVLGGCHIQAAGPLHACHMSILLNTTATPGVWS